MTEGGEDVADEPSSKSSESEDLVTVGNGGMLGEEFWRGSQSKEPPATGSGRASLRSGHWFEFLCDTLGSNSESSSGVAGAGESVEEVEKEEAWSGGCGIGGSGSRIRACLPALTDKLLRNRDCFLTEGDLTVRLVPGSVSVEERVVGAGLSLRLKRATKRRILKGGRGIVQNISQAMGVGGGRDRGTKEGRGGKGFTEVE